MVVVQLILGTAQLAGRYGIMAAEEPSAMRAAKILDAAYRLGIRTLDTAPAYDGAEGAIGAFGPDFVVHTKLPAGHDPFSALAASLERLRRDSVEVLYLHDPDVVLDHANPWLEAVAALVGSGVDRIGASVYTRAQFLAAVADERVTVVQAPMNIIDREISDDDLGLATRSGTEVIVRSALLQGLLGDPERAIGKVPPLDEVLTAFHGVCRHVGRAPLEVAIGWVHRRPALAGLVLGAETPEQLESLVQAFEAPPLTDEVIVLLASLPVPPMRAWDPRTWPLE